MKQYEAVIHIMKENGGYATLGYLYSEVLKISDVEWKTKTPFASIRRIVQDARFFFKIRPGLWALNDFKKKLPFDIEVKGKIKKNDDFNHTYYQGLIVEIGNLKKFNTYVPRQDANKIFLGKSLADIVTINQPLKFSYDQIVNRAKTVDVIWFNRRDMPNTFFEVEHTTPIQLSMLKFLELQDFHVNFRIVAHKTRKNEFQDKVKLGTFEPIFSRTKFISYDLLAELHAKTYELSKLEKEWQ